MRALLPSVASMIEEAGITHFHPAEWDQPVRTVKGVVYPFAKYPDEWIKDRWIPLAKTLEVIRAALGSVSITITSGYRPPEFNKALPGTALKSQHMVGRAADIVVAGVSAAEVHSKVLELYTVHRLPFLGGLGSYLTFTHVDVRPNLVKLARWSGARKDN